MTTSPAPSHLNLVPATVGTGNGAMKTLVVQVEEGEDQCSDMPCPTQPVQMGGHP